MSKPMTGNKVVDFREVCRTAPRGGIGAALAAAAGFADYKEMWTEAEAFREHCFRRRVTVEGGRIVAIPAFHRRDSMPAPRSLTDVELRRWTAAQAVQAYEDWVAAAPHAVAAEPLHRTSALERW